MPNQEGETRHTADSHEQPKLRFNAQPFETRNCGRRGAISLEVELPQDRTT